MNTSIISREIKTSDYPYLRELLYEAIFIPEGAKQFPKSIIDSPDISKYIEDWGKEGDLGIIAFYNKKLVGAIWCRLFDEMHKGYGFINSDIPELSMALVDEYRNQGIGSSLLKEFFSLAKNSGLKAISLSVDKRNKAANFYLKHGFTIVDKLETAYTMKIDI